MGHKHADGKTDTAEHGYTCQAAPSGTLWHADDAEAYEKPGEPQHSKELTEDKAYDDSKTYSGEYICQSHPLEVYTCICKCKKRNDKVIDGITQAVLDML